MASPHTRLLRSLQPHASQVCPTSSQRQLARGSRGVPKRPTRSRVPVATSWRGGARPGAQGSRRVRTPPPPPPPAAPASPGPAPRMQIAALPGRGASAGCQGRGRPAPRSPGERQSRRAAPPERLHHNSAQGRRRTGSSGGAGGGDPGFAGGPAGAHARSLGERWSRPHLGQDGEPGAHALR